MGCMIFLDLEVLPFFNKKLENTQYVLTIGADCMTTNKKHRELAQLTWAKI
jgi:hypothetical protein